jgi:hypothetical protein
MEQQRIDWFSYPIVLADLSYWEDLFVTSLIHY